MKSSTVSIVIVVAIFLVLLGGLALAGLMTPLTDQFDGDDGGGDNSGSADQGGPDDQAGDGSNNQSAVDKPPIISPINASDGQSQGVTKKEPVIALSWLTGPPGSEGTAPEYWQHFSFHSAYTLVLNNTVEEEGNDSLLADIIFFPALTNSQVEVYTYDAADERMKVNLWPDGAGGCFGLLVDDRSNIQEEKAWTWSYDGDASGHAVKFEIIFNVLGHQMFEVDVYDQDTGSKVTTGSLASDARVYGRYMMTSDTTVTYLADPIADNPEATGVMQNLLLHDALNPELGPYYNGTVKDSLFFEGNITVSKVWAYIDGKWEPWNPDADGRYSFYWDMTDGVTTHDFYVQVQYQPPLPTMWGDAVMHYGVYDAGSGENLLPLFGSGHTDNWYFPYWPTSEG